MNSLQLVRGLNVSIPNGKAVIFGFLLLSFTSFGQSYRVDIGPGLRGEVLNSKALYLTADDTLRRIRVQGYYTSLVSSQSTTIQPTLIRTGLKVIIRYSSTIDLQPTTWYKLTVGDQTRYYGRVDIVTSGPTNNPTPTPDPVVLPGSLSGIYTLINSPPGYTITHNKANRLVKATFYRDDTGQIDPLWRIRIVNDNNIQTIGPPSETFSGRLVLDFTNQITN